jgi:hypothetical protein
VAFLRHQQDQQLHRHLFQLDRTPISAQLIPIAIQLEFPELNNLRVHIAAFISSAV